MIQPHNDRPVPRRATLPALCGLALVLVTACGSGSGSGEAASSATSSSSSAPSSASESTAASSPSASAETVVRVKDFAYQVPKTVSPGATVSVMNMDGEAHTVTADEGDVFDAQVTGDGTATFTAPTTPGTYAFHCTYHANMRGALVVK